MLAADSCCRVDTCSPAPLLPSLPSAWYRKQDHIIHIYGRYSDWILDKTTNIFKKLFVSLYYIAKFAFQFETNPSENWTFCMNDGFYCVLHSVYCILRIVQNTYFFYFEFILALLAINKIFYKLCPDLKHIFPFSVHSNILYNVYSPVRRNEKRWRQNPNKTLENLLY